MVLIKSMNYSGAVFIDEAQDYKNEWVESIEKYFLDKDASYVICGDPNQNIYSRKLADSILPRTSIRGRPNELTVNQRMEYNVDFANSFKRAFLYGKYDISDIEGNQLIIPGLEEPIILYEYERVSEVFEELNRLFRIESISPNDVAIVSFTRQGVRDLIDQYNFVCNKKSEMRARKVSRNSRTVSTNGECSKLYMGNKKKINIAERVLKRSFKPNYGTTKALVIHSLKGLEVKNIVLFLDDLNYFDDSKLENTEELIYTAITRAKHRLIIAYKNKEEVKPELDKYIDYFESQNGVNNVIKFDEYKKISGYNLLF